jgi:tetratricopeptide (TPR) repeat protein
LHTLKALFIEKIPFFFCSLASSAITIYAQQKGGAVRSLNEMSFGLRIENSITAYVKYITKTVWPHDLAVLYPFPASVPLWQFVSSLLLLLLVSGASIWARHRWGYLVVGWFWFLVTLIPVIGIIQVGEQSMADRYSYIPLIGLFIMAAWGITDLTMTLQYRKVVLGVLAGIAITASITLTWHQLRYWRDTISLFRRALQVTTGNYIAHGDLGLALAEKGNLDAAIQEFQEALRINPDYYEAHNNLGIAFSQKDNLDAAIQEFQEALRINPKFYRARYNLSLAQKLLQDKARK